MEEGLEEVEIKFSRGISGLKRLEIFEYAVQKIKTKETVDQEQTSRTGTLTHKIRKQFTIVDFNNLSINAESLFSYTREGFLLDAPRTAIFYGKTAKADYPFTLSLVADPATRLMSGKSKRKNVVLDIEGDYYFYTARGKHKTETGFAIYSHGKMVGLINLSSNPTVFMSADLHDYDERKALIFTFLFLSTYERSSRYMINR